MATPPEEKKLRSVPFVLHATRGLIRDRAMRRKVIAILLTVAVVMVLAGSTFFRVPLNPREHFGWFALFWLACAWFTITSLLLAVFDLLLLRAEGRAARRALRERVRPSSTRPNERS
jgi:cytochrome bd-type quinol oxidase subunit 2